MISEFDFGKTKEGTIAKKYLMENSKGMQVYTGNFLNLEKGKDGVLYKKRSGICFETQFYPNACNEPTFPSSILKSEDRYRSKTIYRFELENA